MKNILYFIVGLCVLPIAYVVIALVYIRDAGKRFCEAITTDTKQTSRRYIQR